MPQAKASLAYLGVRDISGEKRTESREFPLGTRMADHGFAT
jgi:hypothetical protein